MNFESVYRKTVTLLDLKEDTEYEETARSIRANSNFKSANAWTLIFAIFIASVGLNTNSGAVIIGAMLISPLMGPIVAAGFGLGIHDYALFKFSARNIFQAMLISIATSTLYFLISPFSVAQSEILARTSPTFYDVLIAVFGGAAGIVAMSRKEKSNAIPGVAIATALMPPLCTVGFGIANLKFSYVLGALYLFIINTVFICLSSYIFVRYLKFPQLNIENQSKSRIDKIAAIIAGIIVIPSLFSAWLLLHESRFSQKATEFIKNEFPYKGSVVLDHEFNFTFKGTSMIKVSTLGESLDAADINNLKDRLFRYGLGDASLKVTQVSFEDRLQKSSQETGLENMKIKSYQEQLLVLENRLNQFQHSDKLAEQVLAEISVFQPLIAKVSLKESEVIITWSKSPTSKMRKTTDDFLVPRLGIETPTFTHVLKL